MRLTWSGLMVRTGEFHLRNWLPDSTVLENYLPKQESRAPLYNIPSTSTIMQAVDKMPRCTFLHRRLKSSRRFFLFAVRFNELCLKAVARMPRTKLLHSRVLPNWLTHYESEASTQHQAFNTGKSLQHLHSVLPRFLSNSAHVPT